jgi:hypothetical protein
MLYIWHFTFIKRGKWSNYHFSPMSQIKAAIYIKNTLWLKAFFCCTWGVTDGFCSDLTNIWIENIPAYICYSSPQALMRLSHAKWMLATVETFLRYWTVRAFQRICTQPQMWLSDNLHIHIPKKERRNMCYSTLIMQHIVGWLNEEVKIATRCTHQKG